MPPALPWLIAQDNEDVLYSLIQLYLEGIESSGFGIGLCLGRALSEKGGSDDTLAWATGTLRGRQQSCH